MKVSTLVKGSLMVIGAVLSGLMVIGYREICKDRPDLKGDNIMETLMNVGGDVLNERKFETGEEES